MALKLKTPEEKEFPLIEADPTGDTKISVRQATQRENELRADLWATASRVMRDGMGSEVELKQRISFPEIMRREVYLTLVACNITGEDDAPIFRFKKNDTGRTYLAMSESQFLDAWGQLPAKVAEEIHKYVLELNKAWGSASGE